MKGHKMARDSEPSSQAKRVVSEDFFLHGDNKDKDA